MSLQELIDKRYTLTRQIEELQRQDKELIHEIAVKLLEDGKKQEFGSEIGYRLSTTTRYEYGKACYTIFEAKGLLGHFQQEPKITKTKMDALLKEGVITYQDLADIETFVNVEQSPYSLTKIAKKEDLKNGFNSII